MNDGPRLKQNRFLGKKAKDNLLYFLKPDHGRFTGYNVALGQLIIALWKELLKEKKGLFPKSFYSFNLKAQKW